MKLIKIESEYGSFDEISDEMNNNSSNEVIACDFKDTSVNKNGK